MGLLDVDKGTPPSIDKQFILPPLSFRPELKQRFCESPLLFECFRLSGNLSIKKRRRNGNKCKGTVGGDFFLGDLKTFKFSVTSVQRNERTVCCFHLETRFFIIVPLRDVPL